jgi:UDP-glucose 4-epimerase
MRLLVTGGAGYIGSVVAAQLLADGHEVVVLDDLSVADPGRYWTSNLGGTLALLDAMRVADVRRLVFSSTAAVYGEPPSVPISETAPARPTARTVPPSSPSTRRSASRPGCTDWRR